jgi:hypothetical protein
MKREAEEKAVKSFTPNKLEEGESSILYLKDTKTLEYNRFYSCMYYSLTKFHI